MLTSKFLTATLTALAVVGSAGFVYAQTASTPDSSAAPGTQAPSMNKGIGTLNQDTHPQKGADPLPQATGTTNQGTGTLTQDTAPTNQGGTTMGQGTDTTTPDRSMDQQLAARADRN